MIEFFLKVILLLIVGVLFIYGVVFGAGVVNTVQCQALQERGLNVILVRRTCYAEIGSGLYLPVNTSATPRTLEEIEAGKR